MATPFLLAIVFTYHRPIHFAEIDPDSGLHLLPVFELTAVVTLAPVTPFFISVLIPVFLLSVL